MNKKTDTLPVFSIGTIAAVGFLALGGLVLGLGSWAIGTRIDGAVIAPGRIVVERNRQAVQHPDGGVVKAILIKEGDAVKEGQVLIRLDAKLTKSELAVVESKFYELMARRGRLEAERDGTHSITFDSELLEAAGRDVKVAGLVAGQQRLFSARSETLAQSIAQLENQQVQLQKQIVGVDAQKESVQKQLQLIKSETEVQEGLLKLGLAQKSRVLALQRDDARLSGSMGDAIARHAQAMERISEIQIQIVKLRSDRREKAISDLRDLEISELQMRERRSTLLTQLERMDIRAPVSGIVYDLRAQGRQSVVKPAEPLLFIVPQDRPLVIEAKVNPVSVNEVHPNQDVILRFQWVDSRTIPDLMGSVTRLSPDAFTDPKTGHSYYLAQIVLPKAEQAKLPPGHILIPGMPVQAFIRTGEHSPLTYLAAPLSRYFSTAMR